jgi:hypothetical protein
MALGQLKFTNCPYAFISATGNFLYAVLNANQETTPSGATSSWYAICLNTGTIIGSNYADSVLAGNACQSHYNGTAG